MMQVLNVRTAIYDQFHGSSAGPAFFFRSENADAYAAYYTSMYLIQDTGEAVLTHMAKGFSPDPVQAYLEFWGVMQAIDIQQDAIFQVVGSVPAIQSGSAWAQLRDTRHLCAGHPANRNHGVPAPQRTFMGRGFGSYDRIQYELWDASTGQITHPVFDLRQMIDHYDSEASTVLGGVLSAMKSKWP
ncbi:MAG TPA: hypothetical protein VFA53_04175 [Xanthobacteraceae bacterium]|nr:hypothetical protein [Xanthobacteraceae bacterium]